MERKFWLVYFFLMLFSSSLSSLWAERYALVIGNMDYQHIQRLSTPANDASDVAKSLKSLSYVKW